MSNRDDIRKALKRQFQTKQDRVEARPGQMGDGYGTVEVAGREHYVYVRVAGMIEEVFNNRVPAENDLLVTVGFDPVQPNLYQVLSTRTATPGGTTGGAIVGFAPASRYHYMAVNGGQDPLFVEKRAYLPLRVGPYSGMLIQVYRDVAWTGSAFAAINTQTVDLAAHIPATTGKAAFVLITIDDSADVIATKGSEVDIADLGLDDLPAVPDGTREVLGAVRVYNGQTAAQEARTNTDFVDLRGVWSAGGGEAHDPVSVSDTDTIDLTLTEQQISADLKNTSVTPGSYTNTNLTVDAQGRITAASSGSSGGGSGDNTTTDNYDSRPAAGNEGNLFFPADGFAIDRDTGAAWVPWGPIYPLTRPPAANTFTWVNQGSATLSEAGGALCMTAPANAGNSVRLVKQALPSAPYTLTVCAITCSQVANYNQNGVITLRESGTGKLITFGVLQAGNTPYIAKRNSPTDGAPATYGIYSMDAGNFLPLFFRVQDNNTNRHYSISADGQNFLLLCTTSNTDFITPDEWGFALDPNYASGLASSMTIISVKVE